MIILMLFAFVAGVVTILSPCILPVLPVILSGAVEGDRRKPFGIIVGFVGSFTFFTLFLSSIIKITGWSADNLRAFSIIIIFIFGLNLLLTKLLSVWELVTGRLLRLIPHPQEYEKHQTGFLSGLVLGGSLGLIWTPCVGPILASVISLALSGTVTSTAFLITLAYSFGTAIPMLAIISGGRRLLQKNPWLTANTGKIQKGFGIVMIITAIGLATNADRKFQTWILATFPSYGTGLTGFENNRQITNALTNLFPKIKPNTTTDPTLDRIIQNNLNMAPELLPGGQWFNTDLVSISGLQGKVVLLDFWTYTCINCIRTLPYLKKWHEAYKDKNLVIIGVHTPEFEFEKNPDNLEKAIQDFGLEYPVMQDNNYATWKAYDNHYWPAKYLIDKNGRIRYTHFGEGKYDETEKMIQALLAETGAEINTPPNNPAYQTYGRTPELYLGYNRINYLYANQAPKLNTRSLYSLPSAEIPDHFFGLVGNWIIGDEWARPDPGSTLRLKFAAREVFLVMRPATGGKAVTAVIRLDGQPIMTKPDNAGTDINTQGRIEITQNRLYKLIRLPAAGTHELYLEFPDGDVLLYAFTFG